MKSVASKELRLLGAIGILVAGLFVVGRAFAQGYFRVAPGPLSIAHAAYDNSEGCVQCHVSGEGVTNQKCLACHGAVKSGQPLSDDEMRALVRQLEQTARPHTCPHGRPTIIKLTRAHLERGFGRV